MWKFEIQGVPPTRQHLHTRGAVGKILSERADQRKPDGRNMSQEGARLSFGVNQTWNPDVSGHSADGLKISYGI
jgi:hypothetical protein